MNDKAQIADYVDRAEAAYTAMYEAAPRNVKDYYEDASFYLARAIEVATALGLAEEIERLRKRSEEIEAVYNHQFRYVGR